MRKLLLLAALVAIFAAGHLSGLFFARQQTLEWMARAAASDPEPMPPRSPDLSRPVSLPAPADPGLPAAMGRYSPEEAADIAVFRNVSPSVVNITTVALRRGGFFSLDVYEMPAGTGSGFVWDRQGHVVTNYHVVRQGRRFVVTLDGEDYEAELVGLAEHKDLAVLEIDAPSSALVPIELGSSADLVVGQKVLAIGNPFGLDQTLTTGVLSALGRELKSPSGLPIRDVIQTDAAINPGNSGGPLLDSAGRLIGINTAIYSPSGASAGIGFAVPVDVVRKLVPDLIRFGKPRQPGIGVELVDDYWARRNRVRGVIVHSVRPGGPAERSGIRGLERTRYGYELGDVIVAVDGQRVEKIEDLVLAFEETGIGGQVRITLRNDGREREVRLPLVAVD
ncbi:MAG: trypsin-like peptidase domain-containing protein [Holophagales bacterium]|nr:trypsin-like peptidase domain-containing protein [Holophagales bacterium]